jgi:lysophospholipase L1-like esterase
MSTLQLRRSTYRILATVLAVGFISAVQVSRAQPGGGPGGARGAGAGGAGQRGGGGGGRGAPAGPPAPVPPAVAIPHPTTDELAKINADLKHFVDTDTSPDKDLLTKYENLINIPMPRNNSAIAPTGGGVRGPRHQAFVDTAAKGGFDILFEGDSITDWWQQAAPNGGTDVQKKYFGDAKVTNFAVAGDTTQGVLWGLKNGEGRNTDGTPVALKPKAIMLMVGTNNASGNNTAPEIAEGVGAIVLELRNDFPDARIMLLAIFPRGTGPTDATRLKNDEANKIIARLDDQKHVFFMNINPKFLDDKGALIGFRNDNLHPTEKGYDTWGAAVAETLKGWTK